uniref:Uncharacterized protein n=1 Tax=virus sp. ct9pU4 TaxID=2828248 RepID=A0A8S5RAW1_9VIRU|nr:MAG TPA: hypothetical protein [virus sp. ct9pU4]
MAIALISTDNCKYYDRADVKTRYTLRSWQLLRNICSVFKQRANLINF